MLADELDYVLGVDTHRDEHVMAVVTAPAGAVVAGAAAARERARLPRVASRRRAARARPPRLGDRGHRQLRRRSRAAFSPNAARRCSRSAAYRAPNGGCSGKDDALDAARIARAALAGDTLALAAGR